MATPNRDTLEVSAKTARQSADMGDHRSTAAIPVARSTWKLLRTVAVEQACEESGDRAPASALLTELAERQGAGGHRD